MRITFVTSTLTSGGSERVMSLLGNCLSQKGYEVVIICLNKQIVFYPLEEKVKVIFLEKELNSKSIFKKFLGLRKIVKEFRPDVVVAFMEAVYSVTLLSLLGIKVPVVSSERIDPRKSPFMRNVIRRLCLPLTTHLVVQTNDIKNFYPCFIRKKTTVIYNPVTDAVFNLAEEPRQNVIISVGRLYRQKNQKMLISSFSQISNEFKDYKLVIYGEGPERKALEDLVRNLKMEDRVLLPGVSDHVIEELNHAKVFCLTSDYEGMSNALIEAICVGLPIISTKVSGVEELIKDGLNGRTVEIGDTSGLVCALRDLLGKEDEMARYGEENRKKAEIFRTTHIVDQWNELLERVITSYYG